MESGSGMTSIRSRSRLINILRDKGIKNEIVLDAMNKIPRHIFVDSGISNRAYENIALPIGWNQTISQPWTVAKITELVVDNLNKIAGCFNRVLEIGCGCGYQSAILADIFRQVYAIERIAPLIDKFKVNINQLNMNNITCSYKDGNEGWQEYAPFDAVIVSAATDRIPEPLLKQLSSKSCMVLPMGSPSSQKLRLITLANDDMKITEHQSVLFVPLLKGIE